MNVRGPCSSCGAQLATDQRYCVECGQRVGPPMALPYAMPAGAMAPPAAGRSGFALPVPLQTISLFAALALGFGVVVGTAISPNLGGIIAAPSPTVVAEAPPPATTPTPATGGGRRWRLRAGRPRPRQRELRLVDPQQQRRWQRRWRWRRQEEEEEAEADSRTSDRHRGARQPGGAELHAGLGRRPGVDSRGIAASGGRPGPEPGAALKNGTYAEQGAAAAAGGTRPGQLQRDRHLLRGPGDPLDPVQQHAARRTDHFVYAVSSLGASVLVSSPPGRPSPPVGPRFRSRSISAPRSSPSPRFPIPISGRTRRRATRPAASRTGPAQDPKTPSLTQTSLTSNPQTHSSRQWCRRVARRPLVLSADDIRSGDATWPRLPSPAGSIPPSSPGRGRPGRRRYRARRDSDPEGHRQRPGHDRRR